MQTKQYTFLDRTGWPPGPWETEPDKVQWPDPATGLPCLARRTPAGIWCGYVGIAQNHPLFGVEIGEKTNELRAHSGVNSSGFCDPGEGVNRVCHVPDPGEPDHVWWFGFDCDYAWDFAPGTQAMYERWGVPGLPAEHQGRCEYRTLAYVQEQCAGLAAQLAGIDLLEFDCKSCGIHVVSLCGIGTMPLCLECAIIAQFPESERAGVAQALHKERPSQELDPCQPTPES